MMVIAFPRILGCIFKCSSPIQDAVPHTPSSLKFYLLFILWLTSVSLMSAAKWKVDIFVPQITMTIIGISKYFLT